MRKTGYLHQDFRLFHIKDQTPRDFFPHYHDFHKIVIFLSGNVIYHIEGKAYHLNPWDIILVNQHAVHQPEIDFSVPYERFILWVRDDISKKPLIECFQKAQDRSFNLVRLDSKLQETLKNLLYELETSFHTEGFGQEILNEALFSQFMIHLNRIFLEKHYIFDKKSFSFDKQIQEILHYINSNLTAELSVETLSQKFFVSKYHLMRRFKEETGYTLHKYINEKRLIFARSLLLQGAGVMQASTLSGFQDYTTFVRAYKKLFHKLPREEEKDQRLL